MAPLLPVIRQFHFHRVLNDIEAAYSAAAAAHNNRPMQIEQDVRRHLGIGPEDPFPDRDDDDEFDHIGRLYDEAGELEEQAMRGAHLVRKAFLIALFHHWERFVKAILGRETYNHPKGWLKRHGREDCARPIRALQKAANCAKHGPGNSCKELFGIRPNLFPGVGSEKEANESRLVIDEATLGEFFAVVRKAAG